MFSYVLNEHLSKAVDFLKLNGSTNSNKTNNNKSINQSSSRTTDLNNNTVVLTSSTIATYQQQNSLLDEYDWFKPFQHNDNNSLSSNDYILVDSQTAAVKQLSAEKRQSTEELESSDDYHQHILLSLYHASLIRQYSVNSTSKKHRLAAQRKMTSYFNQLSINPDRLDDELKSFLEKNKSSFSNSTTNNNNNSNKRQNVSSFTGQTLYDEPSLADNGSLKPVRLFQKAYYKEKIRGELVQVPSWRMKEKMKTISAALVMCLNIGVDPPDVVRPANCSRMECWISKI